MAGQRRFHGYKGAGRTCLVVGLVLAEVPLQLALCGEHLGAHAAGLLPDLPIVAALRLGVTWVVFLIFREKRLDDL